MHALRRLLDEQMTEKGWTAADLARETGLSKQHVSKLLRDERERLPRLPTEDTLVGLARGLRLPLSVVVLRAAAACGVPVEVTEVPVASARALTDEELLAELSRRLRRS